MVENESASHAISQLQYPKSFIAVKVRARAASITSGLFNGSSCSVKITAGLFSGRACFADITAGLFNGSACSVSITAGLFSGRACFASIIVHSQYHESGCFYCLIEFCNPCALNSLGGSQVLQRVL